MKFTYQYKTKDGTQHEGTYSAASRTAVYDELKKTGLKPFNVKLAPGLFNWLSSLGKRTYAIFVLVLALGGTIAYFSLQSAAVVSGPLPRHQIYGDPALMDELERSGFVSVLEHPGERLLARYAQPGRVIATVVEPPDPKSLMECLKRDLRVSSSDSREVAELKGIVLGMKEELREYLDDGVGTADTYLRRLRERLQDELAIRERFEAELGESPDPVALRAANQSLRNLGLRPIVISPAER